MFNEVQHPVLKDSEVQQKNDLDELVKYGKAWAKEDGCIHYILKKQDGTYFQLPDMLLENQNVEEYAEKNSLEIVKVLEP